MERNKNDWRDWMRHAQLEYWSERERMVEPRTIGINNENMISQKIRIRMQQIELVLVFVESTWLS